MAVNFFPEVGAGGGVTGDYIPLTQRGSANGVATLDSSAKIPQSQLPSLSITDTFVVASEAEMLALIAQTGDIAVRTDNSKTFILKSSPATSLSNWVELPTPTDGVFSVDGKIGAVVLSNDYQAKSNELSALSALSDTPGFIKKISNGVYAIDSSSYLTTTSASASYQPLNSGLTSISGLTIDGYLIKVGGAWGMDTNSYQIQDADLTAIASLTTTGYLERTGTNTWRTVSGPFQPLDSDLTDIAGLTGNGIIRKTAGVWGIDSNNYQIANNELSGFSVLPDVQGFVRKVGDGSYTLDSNTYLTTASALSSYQPLNINLTGISGLVGTTGIPKMTDGVWSLDASAYLTGNQTITLSGDASGSGTTAINVTLPNIVTGGSNSKITYNAKGLVIGGTALTASDIPGGIDWSKLTGQPTTVSGYGITNAYTKTETDTAISTYSFSKSEVNTSLASKQNTNNELTAFIALADTQGFVRKVGDGSYTLDANTYLTTSSAMSSYQPLNTNLTNISGVTGTSGFLKQTGGVWGLDGSTYITGNQNITISGDVTGSGTTAINVTLPNIATAGTYPKVTVNAKGQVTSGSSLLATDIPSLDWAKITTGKPTTLLGYGITDALTVAGSGLTSTGNTINAIGSAGRIVANADSIDLATVGTVGTYTKITTDAYGRAISGTTLIPSDIPNLDASKIISGTFSDARLAGDYTGMGALTASTFFVRNTASWDTAAGRVMAESNPGRLQITGIPPINGGTRLIEMNGAVLNILNITASNTGKGIYLSSSINSVSSFRWLIYASPSNTETGSNEGSDFLIDRYSDAGGGLQTAFTIKRSNGVVSIASTVASTSTTTGALVISGGVGVQGNQYIEGFTSLGGGANHPAIKIKVLTGTTASTEGGTASVAHGVTSSKIVSIQVLVESSPGVFISNLHVIAEGYSFDFYFDSVNVAIRNQAAKSANILSKPFKVTIIYTA